MWKCLNCETMNDGEVCVICGEAKPTAAESARAENTGQPRSYEPISDCTYVPSYVSTSMGYYAERPRKNKFNKFCVVGFALSMVPVGFGLMGIIINMFW